MENLANFIMVRYYLTNELEQTDIDLSEKEVELYEQARKEAGSEQKLKDFLDSYIAEHDWTGYLGKVGSGNRERGFAIEGTMEYGASHASDNAFINEEYDEMFESIYNKN